MEPGDAGLIKGGTLAEGTEGLSRRGFMRAAGLSLIGAAAAGGALSLAGCSSDNAQGGVAVENKGGCGDFNESLYTDAFPVKTRNVPVIDVESGIVRQGNVAFEMRNIAENEIVRTEETDVLVCGCGLTGSVAALAASDDGETRVLCIEKMSKGRGMFEGMGVVGGSVMEAAGNEVDKAEMMDRMRHAAYYRVPIDPIKLWADRSGEAADWLQEKFDEGEAGIVSSSKPIIRTRIISMFLRRKLNSSATNGAKRRRKMPVALVFILLLTWQIRLASVRMPICVITRRLCSSNKTMRVA